MRISLSVACILLVSAPTLAAAPVDFSKEIHPLFADYCYKCHGPDEKARKAKLRLDVREEALTAKAFVPGKPDESELVKRVCSADPEMRMPPEKSKKPALNAEQIALVKRWIAEGAKYSEHWSFGKLARPAEPEIRKPQFDIRNPIDSFILAKLSDSGVSPSPEADRVTLIRRLYFDLTGLPPSPEEVHAFVADKTPDAYEKLVDKLLASPHHGERLAMWWLDLVRYADSAGYHSDNPINISPFRDYVIKSFNANKPFDQFTIEQLAGDLLPNPTLEQRVASAYNRLLLTTEEGGGQAKEYEAKYSADRVRNFGQVWLGGTIMCAECHNHKFDPYTQADFYSIAAFFADIQEPSIGNRGPGTPVPTPDQSKKLTELGEAAAKIQSRASALGGVLPWAALKRDRDAVAAAIKARTDFENALPHVLMTVSGPPRTVRILARGNWQDETGPVMKPKTPGFLPPLPPLAAGVGRYNRLDLAKWTVAPNNPLTARVAVNRLWRLFYGYGIARSLEESGSQGQWPTHPELLDWLASEFQTKWDVRHIVRLMVTSATYRQSSVETPAIREHDPANKLFARQSRSRLDAEFIRDGALAVSGLLSNKVGGDSVKPFQPLGYWAALNFPTREWQKDTGEKEYRRGMYTHWQRTFPHPAMIAFDAPSREECTCDRPRSNIPQQALVLLNDPEFVEAARVFAQKALADGGKADDARIAWVFERATSRKPKAEEVAVLTSVLAKHRTDFAAKPDDAKKLLAIGDTPAPKDVKPEELAAWTSVCRVILNLHETITRQ
jgi:Protein of unknown function (DUF1553)/Protein of unknown function (DUF1549)/Planctomycete cytochrome C